MPTELRSRIHTPYTPKLDLPPAFREVTLREAGDAFGHAQKIAAKEGAGTLVWVRRFDIAEFAVVLEPEEPLAAARRSHYWRFARCSTRSPSTRRRRSTSVSSGPTRSWWTAGSSPARNSPGPRAPTRSRRRLGSSSARWSAPQSWARESRAPVPTRRRWRKKASTSSAPGRLIETFARHLLSWIDVWQTDGFLPVAKHYLERLPADESVERSIDGLGDLLTRRKGKLDTTKQQLVPALKKRDWYDAESRGLKL
jgi:hypothetical protein